AIVDRDLQHALAADDRDPDTPHLQLTAQGGAMIRRLLFIALGIAGVVAVALGLLYWQFESRFHVSPPSPDYPAPKSALEAQQQDIDYLSKLIALDRSYTPQARAEAERRLKDLAALDHVLTRAQLRVAMSQLAALADNGHTSA